MSRVFSVLLYLVFGSSTLFAALGDEFEEIEHLWLTQNVHVSAEYLCQDGIYMYFKDKEACGMATPSVTCEFSTRISPLKFIEKVELPSGDSVTRFFTLPNFYQYSKYELSESGPIKSYDLVESKQIPIPICDGMKKIETKKIRRIRKSLKKEVAFMQGMVDSGVSIVNSPYGYFDPKSLLKFEQLPTDSAGPQVKSPLCSKKLDYNTLITQASGEWTGNGVVKVSALENWQGESQNLYVQKSLDQSKKTQYEFFCMDEVQDDQ